MHRLFICMLILFQMLTFDGLAAQRLPVRLHVRAEDDGVYAQQVKLHVKDRVVEEARRLIQGCAGEEEAYAKLFLHLPLLRKTAHLAACETGFDGGIHVSVGREYFPARLYGSTLLKEGEYPSVCVDIGSGEGKNWWCVIFPTLCGIEEIEPETEIRFYSGIAGFFQRLFG